MVLRDFVILESAAWFYIMPIVNITIIKRVTNGASIHYSFLLLTFSILLYC
jgi:hypothetical protein